MADIVNLRQARKQKRRADAETAARENRAKFGRSKAARPLADLARRRAEAAHAGHKRTAPAAAGGNTDDS